MMERNTRCSVVSDLLPAYVEGLTKTETTSFVDAHLTECEQCRSAYHAMSGRQHQPTAEADALVGKLRRHRQHSLWLRWGIAIGVVMVLAALLLPWPKSISVVHQGLEWRCGDAGHVLERTVTLEGTYYDSLLMQDRFRGRVQVEGYPQTDNSSAECVFVADQQGYLYYSDGEGRLEAFASVLLEPDGSRILLCICEDGHWDSGNGLMLTAPAVTRQEAVCTANAMADELSSAWLGSADDFE
ncbi:MAG: zf-HC2 domain-containing protein [Clostridia bacterium]|nr:zf-HC2 domain-containing protein [Clostridia bacterium]